MAAPIPKASGDSNRVTRMKLSWQAMLYRSSLLATAGNKQSVRCLSLCSHSGSSRRQCSDADIPSAATVDSIAQYQISAPGSLICSLSSCLPSTETKTSPILFYLFASIWLFTCSHLCAYFMCYKSKNESFNCYLLKQREHNRWFLFHSSFFLVQSSFLLSLFFSTQLFARSDHWW